MAPLISPAPLTLERPRFEPLTPNTRRSDLALRLRGVRVCHLTPIQRARDERAFTREALPSLAFGLRACILGPHSISGPIDEVEFASVPKCRNRLMRILLAARLACWALKHDADIYHVHNPEMIPAGLLLRLVFRKKVVYDTREDFPSMMLTKAYLPERWRPAISRLVSAIEGLAARFLNGVVTADAGSLRPLARKGKSRKLVLYNFPNLKFFPECRSPQKQFDLVYRGGLSERAGTFVLLRALHLLLNRGVPVRLLLFGYTDDPQSEQFLRDSLVAHGIGHLVTLRGTIPHDEMASTLSLARIAVCPLLGIPKFMNNIPVKLFESWACGLPVIASDLPPIRPFFQGRKLGMLVKPGDIHGLAHAIRQMLASPDLIEEYGRRARQVVVERYNIGMEIPKLLSLYERVLLC
jgi:glycosyltransferase involved in cell wall biosynthesis